MSENQPVIIPDFERLASGWLGAIGNEYSEHRFGGAQLDLVVNAWVSKFTGNISPVAMANTYFDWISHLQLAPSKQQKLIEKGLQKYWLWSVYTVESARPDHVKSNKCIEPLPQDKRFGGPEWEQWPYNTFAQGFLLTQQWWHRATTGIRGVSRHHEDVATFTARQLLDMVAPSNFLLTNPIVQHETWRSGGMNLLRGAQNALADWQRNAADGKTAREARYLPGKTVAVTPGKVVYRNRLIELIQYEPSTARVHAKPILIVPAWIMKYYILDLSPENSLVKYMVDQGYTVFMISWKNPVAEDRDLSMEDYRTLGVMSAIDAMTRITGAEQIDAVGYCLGGTLLTIAAATMARDGDMRLASMSLFASQVDFKEPGELSLFIDESQISFLEASMWSQGYLDTKQMAGAFQLIRSNDLIWSHRLHQYLLGMPEPDSDLMAWNADATRMPYRMHSEYLRQLFLQNDLAEGRYRTEGRTVGLTDIHVPIFAVGTVTDHVAPWRSVFKIHLFTDSDVTFLLTSGGHNAGVVSPPGHPNRNYQMATRPHDGIYVDPDTWQHTVTHREGSWWPAWETWLSQRSGGMIDPPAIGEAICDAPGTYVLQT